MASCPKTTPIFYPLTNSAKTQVSSHQNRRRKFSVLKRNGGRAAVVQCSATASDGELRILQEGQRQNGYLTRGFGWGVRRMERVGDEMRRVAEVQAEAFHEPAALFNDFFFEFFKAEVLSALIYRIRNSPPDRYACLVTESINNESNSQGIPELVGVVDVTVQREDDVLQHLQGAQEYLYVSGIAVLIKFRHDEKGTVIFLHGFPEIWYTWRHQMLAVAEAGYRAIAPDCRGYGLSEQPKEEGNAKWEDLIDDVVAILDSFHISKAFIVGKDFAAISTYDFALRYPERVSGVVTLGLPFSPKGFALDLIPKGFYAWRWMEPGRAEKDFGRFDVKTVIRNIYILFSRSELQIAGEGEEIMDLIELSTPLPAWFTEDDLQVYASLYEKSGFKFPLQMPYRSVHRMMKWVDPKVEAPAMLIMCEKDYCIKFPGMEDYIKSGMVKQFVPNLETVVMPEGTHFVHEQSADEVNKLIVAFLNNHVLTG